MYIKNIISIHKEIICIEFPEKYTLDSYIMSIKHFILAKESFEKRQYANISSYDIAQKTFYDEFGMAFFSFIHNSYEYHIAVSFLCAIATAIKDNHPLRACKCNSSHFVPINYSFSIIYPNGFDANTVMITLFEINSYCNHHSINLKYYVDEILKYLKEGSLKRINKQGFKQYSNKQEYV